MCDECIEFKKPAHMMIIDHIDFIINKHRRNKSITTYHCLSGPARIFLKDNVIIHKDWYINGLYVTDISQDKFEKSLQYREWKLKAFT